MAGLRWEDVRKDEIQVSRSMWRGHENDRAKTVASRASVPVIPSLSAILEEHREGKTTGLVFDLDLQKVGVRIIAPTCASLGLTWWGFHALRRGIATNLYSLGATDKIVQRVLRHAKASITRERYIKSVATDVQAAMLQMDAAVGTLLVRKPGLVN